MDGLDGEAYDRSYTDKALVTRIIAYFGPHKGKMAIVAVMIVLGAIVNTAMPAFISQGIDSLSTTGTADAVRPALILITVLGVLSYFFNMLRRWLSGVMVGDVMLKVREEAFDA